MIDPKTRDAYAQRVGSLCSDCSVLTASVLSDINQVFYGEGPDGDLSATNLSIRYVTGQEYHDLVTGASGQFEPKTLYVVSSDQINAYNSQIKNVGDPEEEKDAANKWYVDYACESVLNIVEESCAASCMGLSSVSAVYENGHIYLSANTEVVGDIDCSSFSKDGCVSAIELCSTKLVLKLTPDASDSMLSVDLSSLSGIGVTEQWVNDQISDMLTPNNISARLEDNHICLSAKGVIVGDIDCSSFFDDTRVSNAQLCGTQLVMSFSDGSQSISAELSGLPDAWASQAEWIFDCN